MKDTIKFEVAQAERFTGADVGRALARQAQDVRAEPAVLRALRLLRAAGHAGVAVRRERAVSDQIAGTPMATTSTGCGRVATSRFMANPAMSVPAGFTPAGLPVGIQIVGRHRDEWSLLQMAHAFEQATRARTCDVRPCRASDSR